MIIKVDNVEYELNFNKAVLNDCVRRVPEKTYKLGDKLEDRHGNQFMIIQCQAYQMCIVEMRSGNRMVDPIAVKNVTEITQDELNKMGGASFKKIES